MYHRVLHGRYFENMLWVVCFKAQVVFELLLEIVAASLFCFVVILSS